jgi:hypothetical protein
MMSEKCRTISRIIQGWEENGSLTEEELEAIENHIDECTDCREEYALLVPFLEHDVTYEQQNIDQTGRDAERTYDREEDHSLLPPTGEPLGEAFTDRVMQEVERTSPKRRRARAAPVLAAAAALLLVAGLVLHFAVLPLGPGQSGQTAQESEATQYVEVHFTLTAPNAESVALVGDFTGWETSKIKLKDPNDDGMWEATVKLKKDNVYLYNFVIDGEKWVVDPDSIIQVDDDFGGESSLLKL